MSLSPMPYSRFLLIPSRIGNSIDVPLRWLLYKTGREDGRPSIWCHCMSLSSSQSVRSKLIPLEAGWNMFFAMTSYVIFEATIINTLVEYWGYNQSPAILITVSLVIYFMLNVYRADLFGEAECEFMSWAYGCSGLIN